MRNPKNDQINFRTTSLERVMIQTAANMRNVTESEYARKSALKQAEMDIADQTAFNISESEMKAFAAALERPAVAKPRLSKLLREHQDE